MKFPLRSHLFFVASFLILGTFAPALAEAGPSADSRPAGIPDQPENVSSSEPGSTLIIPGPLRSFLRMAGISQEISTDEVLPTLARNAALYGYQAGRETEFLVLVSRYVHLG